MDVFTEVVHKTAWLEDVENVPEMTRLAFHNIFGSNSLDAKLVAKFIVDRCRYKDMTETNSGIMEAKQNTARNIIIGIMDQLNREPIKEEELDESSI